MSKIIVDANIIFSALLSSQNRIRDTLLYDAGSKFFSCKFLFIELFKHKQRICRYSKLKDDEILTVLHAIFNRIYFVDDGLISAPSLKQAYELCRDIDEKDMVFVALTLELDGLLWTGDKKLKKGLQKKGFDSFFTSSSPSKRGSGG